MKAFPTNPIQFTDKEGEEVVIKGHEGMDLRDYFAIHASQEDLNPYIRNIIGYYEDEEEPYYDFLVSAKARYQFADAMMEARK